MQWMTIFQKEMLHLWRNKQLIWVPLVMMLIAVMDPLTFYFLPEILEISGGLPEGAVFEVPKLGPNDAIMMGIEALSFTGTLVIALISMGTIANERKSGVAEIILTKPINPINYITAKWFALFVISLLSVLLALITNWYYTNILFGEISFGTIATTFFFYMFWFMLIVTIAIFFNSFLSKPGIVFALTAIVIFLMSLINTFLGHKLTYLPNQLASHIQLMLESNEIPNELYMTTAIILFVVVILLGSATTIFKYKKL